MEWSAFTPLLFLPFLFLGWTIAGYFCPRFPARWIQAPTWALVGMILLPMLLGPCFGDFGRVVVGASGLALLIGLLLFIAGRLRARFSLPQTWTIPWNLFLAILVTAALIGLVGFNVSIH